MPQPPYMNTRTPNEPDFVKQLRKDVDELLRRPPPVPPKRFVREAVLPIVGEEAEGEL